MTLSLQELIQKKKFTCEHDLLTYEILNCINLKEKSRDWAKFLEICLPKREGTEREFFFRVP